MREEVVGLEDDADLLAQRVDVDLVVGDALAVDDDLALLDALEQVEAAQERRLAGAGRADQADDVVLGDVEVDLVEHLQSSPNHFADAAQLDERRSLPLVLKTPGRARAARAARRGGR